MILMPDQEPLIISSPNPFKVEATPAKFGGVDALAKRPLDMSKQADSLVDHLASINPSAPLSDSSALIEGREGGDLSDSHATLPSSAGMKDTWVQLPPEAGRDDSYANLPGGDPAAAGSEGPLLQTLLDTSHREHFDDPSRYLRTDVTVKIPSADSPRRMHAVAQAGKASLAKEPATPVTSADTPRAEPGRTSDRALPEADLGTTQLLPSDQRAQLAAAVAALPAHAVPTGTPEQRRQAFSQRLAQIMEDHQQIGEELSAVEQAAQVTRAQMLDQLTPEPAPTLSSSTVTQPASSLRPEPPLPE